MAYLGVNPSERAYKQTPIYKAVAGETLLPISVGSPDSLLLRNGVILTKDVSNPTDYDWSVDPTTNRPRLVKGAVEGDEFTFIEFAGVTLPDMLSKSRTNQQLAESPSVITPPVARRQMALMHDVYSATYRKNKVLNPCFEISQREDAGIAYPTVAGGNTYTMDGWFWNSGTSEAVAGFATARGKSPSDYLSGKIPSPHYGKFKATCSIPATTQRFVAAISQRLENFLWCAGKKVTLSFWAKGDTPGIIGVVLGNSAANSPSFKVRCPLTEQVEITTDWKRYSFTVTLPDLATLGIAANAVNYLNLDFITWVLNDSESTAYLGTINYNSALYLTGVQLEEGEVATEFIPSTDPTLELLLCQRYYYAARQGLIGMPDSGAAPSTRVVNMYFPVTMRTVPTVTLNALKNDNATSYQILNPSATGVTISILGATTNSDWTRVQPGSQYSAEL